MKFKDIVAKVKEINPGAVKSMATYTKDAFPEVVDLGNREFRDISELFLWKYTKEGHEFWAELNDKFLDR